MISRSYGKYVEIHDFLPLPSVFDSTPDPVREFIYSALHGMVLDSVLLRVRPDIKVLTNGVLCYLRELQERFIPVSVFDGKATAENLSAYFSRGLGGRGGG